MISDHIILSEAVSRPFPAWEARSCPQSSPSKHWWPFPPTYVRISSSSHLLTGMSHFILLLSFNASSIYDSGALTDIYAEPSSRRCPLLRDEGAPLGGNAEARHRCKWHSVLTLLQSLSQKVKWHIHPMVVIRLQRKIKKV